MTSKNKEVFRSPYAVAVWWLWLLFAVGNLIDIAVQGRDHLSLVAAAVLLLVTGVMYVTAQRPRIVAGEDGMEIVNPLRGHRVGWTAVDKVDATELVRVRCEWPGEPDEVRKQVIYSWAVRSSRRKHLSSQLRAQRRARGQGGARGFGAGGYAAGGRADPPPAPVLDADRVVAALTERADQAKAAEPEAKASPPVSAWYWPGVAAIVVPALVLLIVALA